MPRISNRGRGDHSNRAHGLLPLADLPASAPNALTHRSIQPDAPGLQAPGSGQPATAPGVASANTLASLATAASLAAAAFIAANGGPAAAATDATTANAVAATLAADASSASDDTGFLGVGAASVMERDSRAIGAPGGVGGGPGTPASDGGRAAGNGSGRGQRRSGSAGRGKPASSGRGRTAPAWKVRYWAKLAKRAPEHRGRHWVTQARNDRRPVTAAEQAVIARAAASSDKPGAGVIRWRATCPEGVQYNAGPWVTSYEGLRIPDGLCRFACERVWSVRRWTLALVGRPLGIRQCVAAVRAVAAARGLRPGQVVGCEPLPGRRVCRWEPGGVRRRMTAGGRPGK